MDKEEGLAEVLERVRREAREVLRKTAEMYASDD